MGASALKANSADHRKIFAIALPMIISNIAAPMLGLVDTAIIGHLPQAIFLSAVAIGAMVLSFLYLMAVFLRMSTTALVAQAFGSNNLTAQQQHVQHGLMFAVGIGASFIVLLPLALPILAIILAIDGELLQLTQQYLTIRIWGAPAALINLVLLGVLLARQRAKTAMLLVIFTNAVNVIGDIVLIIGFNLHVVGAAWASLLAEWSTALLGLWIIRSQLQMQGYFRLRSWRLWQPHWPALSALTRMNGDIFVRSLALQLCMAMMTGYATYYGANVVAANAVLMQFLVLISLGLDGIAYAVEALIGAAKGQRNPDKIRRWYQLGWRWSLAFALLYSLLFWSLGSLIISSITNIPSVVTTAETYLPWLIVLPLIAHWSYFFDGVFIGLGASKAMRNTMLIAAVGVFLPIWAITNLTALTPNLGNHSLWLALCCFMLARGVGQWLWWQRNYHRISA